MVTAPSFHFAPARSPVALSGESTSLASLPASSRIASTTSSVTSSQPGSVLTWSRPTTCFSTNCISFRGAAYSAIGVLPSALHGRDRRGRDVDQARGVVAEIAQDVVAEGGDVTTAAVDERVDDAGHV